MSITTEFDTLSGLDNVRQQVATMGNFMEGGAEQALYVMTVLGPEVAKLVQAAKEHVAIYQDRGWITAAEVQAIRKHLREG